MDKEKKIEYLDEKLNPPENYIPNDDATGLDEIRQELAELKNEVTTQVELQEFKEEVVGEVFQTYATDLVEGLESNMNQLVQNLEAFDSTIAGI